VNTLRYPGSEDSLPSLKVLLDAPVIFDAFELSPGGRRRTTICEGSPSQWSRRLTVIRLGTDTLVVGSQGLL
jgi:hypothetical protein